MTAEPHTRDCSCDPRLRGFLRTNKRFAYYVPCDDCLADCPECGGMGYVFERDENGYEMSRRCPECGLQRDAMARFNRANILADFADAKIEDLDTSDRSSNLRIVTERVRRWMHAFAPGAKGFCLIGGVGTGKTHLLTTAVRHAVLGKGLSAKYVDFSILLNDLRQAYDTDTQTTPIIKPLVETQLLAIDELGKGRKSEWELTIIDQLINERYSRGMTTIAATNFDVDDNEASKVRRGLDHDTLVNATREGLELRVGPHLFSRLCAMTDFVHVDAPDHRKQ